MNKLFYTYPNDLVKNKEKHHSVWIGLLTIVKAHMEKEWIVCIYVRVLY